MKIFYIKQSLFESSYRCEMVRRRLIKYVREERPQVLVISGCQNKSEENYLAFLEALKPLNVVVIDKAGKYKVEDVMVLLSDTHLVINNKLITPMEGCVSLLRTNPFSLNYIVLDIFADEHFSNYHGDLDEQHLQELAELLNKP